MVDRLKITQNHKDSIKALIKLAVAEDDLNAAKMANERLLKQFKFITSFANEEENPLIFTLSQSILSSSKELLSAESRDNMEKLLNLL